MESQEKKVHSVKQVQVSFIPRKGHRYRIMCM